MSGEEQVPVTEQLTDNMDRGRFELCRDDHLVGWLYYTHLKPNRYALRHTEVETSHQRQGVAGALVRRVFDEIRARGARSPQSAPSWSTTSREEPPTPIWSTPGTRATPIVLLPSRHGCRLVAEATGAQLAVPSEEPHCGLTTCCLEHLGGVQRRSRRPG